MGVIRRLRWLIRAGLIVWALTAVAVVWQAREMLAAHGDGRSISDPVEITIVLASGVDPDLVLGFSSRRRVKAGVELWQAGKTGRLLMSGGPIGHGPGSSAALMRDHAISLGVPADRILVEERSRTTFENLRFSKQIIRDEGATRIAVLTDDMHLARSARLAGFLGLGGVELAAARGMTSEPLIRRIAAIGREALAWWYNLGKVTVWWAMGEAGYEEDARGKVVS